MRLYRMPDVLTGSTSAPPSTLSRTACTTSGTGLTSARGTPSAASSAARYATHCTLPVHRSPVQVYPGLMYTSGFIHWLTQTLSVPIDIREICVFLAPLYSSFTTIATFLLTKELHDTKSGLVAAVFIAVVPGYISRSVAGSYDNEGASLQWQSCCCRLTADPGIAIFCMIFTYYLWVKSVKTGSVFWSTGAALAYFYMVRGPLLAMPSDTLTSYAGLIMGRLRVPDQPHSAPRLCPHCDPLVRPQGVCGVLDGLLKHGAMTCFEMNPRSTFWAPFCPCKYPLLVSVPSRPVSTWLRSECSVCFKSQVVQCSSI